MSQIWSFVDQEMKLLILIILSSLMSLDGLLWYITMFLRHFNFTWMCQPQQIFLHNFLCFLDGSHLCEISLLWPLFPTHSQDVWIVHIDTLLKSLESFFQESLTGSRAPYGEIVACSATLQCVKHEKSCFCSWLGIYFLVFTLQVKRRQVLF